MGLAFRHGSVAEIIDQGVTGGIVDTMDEAVMMLPRLIELDRRAVRRRFEQRFSSVLMAKDYVAVYRSLLKFAGGRLIGIYFGVGISYTPPILALGLATLLPRLALPLSAALVKKKRGPL